MNTGGNAASVAVLLFGDRRAPTPLRSLTTHRVTSPADVDAAAKPCQRLVVVGADADLATVLTRLLRAELLSVEVAYVPRRRTPATRAYRLPARWRAARRARRGTAKRVPLIRDETGSVIVGAAEWQPAGDAQLLHGEAVVDDTVLFDGHFGGARIEPTATVPGLRARLAGRRRWVTGRAAQLGTTGATVIRDGIPAARPVRRSTFYRNTEGWLVVR
ncbi:peptidase M50 [Mycobacterium kyorinense]|uniref:Peptidase M50 n=1 Tax=Mycobacterium kyorinense TaxID=487514 RepID=A0A1A2Z2F6_9MYCO|nr:peptidase M50 [Mycobacterium kyorinense]OBI43682.1 peptidase M50 [Mycobacterium kyorinense]